MTQPTTTSSAAEVAGYLKQWMFDPNHAHHPLRAKPDFNGSADRNTNLKNSRTRKPGCAQPPRSVPGPPSVPLPW